uniref:Dihydroorotase n=1 Tax=uncultured Spirochaetaceae bacterium TaxID=201186 RepID=A0A650ER50_9SPIO|nr:dihydroorotase [uncultured Spirochaetaceae bacterium]
MKIIYNAILLDESMRTRGAIVLDRKKIVRVLKGNFKTESAVLEGAKSACDKKVFSKKSLSHIEFVNANGLTLAPAFIDMHAHFRYPGLTQKEDLQSALNAAAAGGFGTLVLMPNTNPVVSSKELAIKIDGEAAAQKKSQVFQTVSITKDFDGATISHLDSLEKKSTPVISEDGRDVESAAVMLEAMQSAAKKGIIVACHSEDCALAIKAKFYRKQALEIITNYNMNIQDLSQICDKKNKISEKIPKLAINEAKKNIFIANSILELAEDIATERNIAIARKANCKIHICHVSTKNSIDAVRRAKKDIANLKENIASGKPQFQITCEVTPHHLGLIGTRGKEIFEFVNPPLRGEEDRAALIQALRDGTADVIATDHAPHTACDKAAGAPGFSGLETAYAFCHTVLVEQENFSEQKLSQLMSANPARILGLKKGLLKEGYDADLVLLDPQEKWKVRSAEFLSKGKSTPLEGKILTGRVKKILFS